MYKKIRNFCEFFALAIIGSETFKREPSVGLYSILYIGQALAAGPNSKFNYFQLHSSVL